LVAQIETAKGVAAAAEVAAVEGVDVLFVGPTDLGCSLAGGKPLAFDDPQLVAARRAVADAARAAGITGGELGARAEHRRSLAQRVAHQSLPIADEHETTPLRLVELAPARRNGARALPP
jgi:2-keto-3-deoxy-L-rhamnonate aldolase RhmA